MFGVEVAFEMARNCLETLSSRSAMCVGTTILSGVILNETEDKDATKAFIDELWALIEKYLGKENRNG